MATINKHTLRKQQRTVELIQMLIPVFSEQGMDQPTIKELAAVIDRGDMVLFRHFGSKEGMVVMCAEYARPRMQQGLTRVIKKYAGQPQLLPDKILSYLDRNLDTFRFVMQVVAHPVYSQKISGGNALVADEISHWADMLAQEGFVPAETALGVANLLNSVIDEYVLKKSPEIYRLQMSTLTALIGPR